MVAQRITRSDIHLFYSPMDVDLPSVSSMSSPGSESTAGFEIELDLGAFELVDSGVSAEALLSQEDPVMYHANLPIHSVHHDTVQTETALENLMNAPESMLTTSIPPTLVGDNYCFVVDGNAVRMGDIMGDDQWWRHTSRPTKYYYSEDMKKFQKVNCVTAKGKVISARLATMSKIELAAGATSSLAPSTSSGGASPASTPRSSFSGFSGSGPPSRQGSVSRQAANRGEEVPLKHVYKVIRFYSFWKTCTAFHRIVTMIDRANDDKNANPEFKKRLFVQYLWRNAKGNEKARVQKEFDPRRQRLLRFVTDPANRKRVFQL